MPESITIRPEQPGDAAAISAVHRAAFPGPGEARLVELLRDAGNLTLSLVAVHDNQIVGHIACSPVTLNGQPLTPPALGLAPVAVLPEFQNQGIGSELIHTSLDSCRSQSCPWIVVLGEPAYYARFGFVPASRCGLTCIYTAEDYFQALELVPGSLQNLSGLVRYAPEFDSLEG